MAIILLRAEPSRIVLETSTKELLRVGMTGTLPKQIFQRASHEFKLHLYLVVGVHVYVINKTVRLGSCWIEKIEIEFDPTIMRVRHSWVRNCNVRLTRWLSYSHRSPKYADGQRERLSFTPLLRTRTPWWHTCCAPSVVIDCRFKKSKIDAVIGQSKGNSFRSTEVGF